MGIIRSAAKLIVRKLGKSSTDKDLEKEGIDPKKVDEINKKNKAKTKVGEKVVDAVGGAVKTAGKLNDIRVTVKNAWNNVLGHANKLPKGAKIIGGDLLGASALKSIHGIARARADRSKTRALNSIMKSNPDIFKYNGKTMKFSESRNDALHEEIGKAYKIAHKSLPFVGATLGGGSGAVGGALIGSAIGALSGRNGSRGASALKGLMRGSLVGTGLGALGGGLGGAGLKSLFPKEMTPEMMNDYLKKYHTNR